MSCSKFTSAETANDTRMNDTNEEKAISGSTNPANDAPGNVQAVTFTPLTKKVKRYKTITLINHESNPNVRRFIGIKSIFRSGATNSIRRLNTKPASKSTGHPPLIWSAGSI